MGRLRTPRRRFSPKAINKENDNENDCRRAPIRVAQHERSLKQRRAITTREEKRSKAVAKGGVDAIKERS